MRCVFSEGLVTSTTLSCERGVFSCFSLAFCGLGGNCRFFGVNTIVFCDFLRKAWLAFSACIAACCLCFSRSAACS